jgi:hypothetical protein
MNSNSRERRGWMKRQWIRSRGNYELIQRLDTISMYCNSVYLILGKFFIDTKDDWGITLMPIVELLY